MMGRVTKNDLNPCGIDQPVGKRRMRSGDFVPPVASPVDRENDDIAGLSTFVHRRPNPVGRFRRKVGKEADARPVCSGGPGWLDAAALRANGEDDDAALALGHENGRRLCLGAIAPGAHVLDADIVQRRQGSPGDRESPNPSRGCWQVCSSRFRPS